jgi:CheY-like chemotaxis protein
MGFKKGILIVDDDEICVYLSMAILRSSEKVGEVHTVQNGVEAIKFLREHPPPDIILLDINMPVMNGFSFLDTFNKTPFPFKECIKIIILTSSDMTEDVKKAEAMGITNYIVKPISADKLKAILE